MDETKFYKEKLDNACPYFKHPYVHESPGHVHLCTNDRNLTARCGYEADEWANCPISGDKHVKENKAN